MTHANLIPVARYMGAIIKPHMRPTVLSHLLHGVRVYVPAVRCTWPCMTKAALKEQGMKAGYTIAQSGLGNTGFLHEKDAWEAANALTSEAMENGWL